MGISSISIIMEKILVISLWVAAAIGAPDADPQIPLVHTNAYYYPPLSLNVQPSVNHLHWTRGHTVITGGTPWKTCFTIDNGRNECEFPFVYKGKVYNGCTREWHSDHKLWCHTKSQIHGKVDWGHCSASCPQH